MSLPDQRDPNQRRELENLERRRLAGGSAAGWWFTWWWIWLLFLVAIVWFGGWGWGGYGGWWWGRPRAVAVYRVSGPGIAVLNATDKQPYVGQQFQVENVPVQKRVTNEVLWVGTNNSAPILLVLTGPGNSAANAGIRRGNLVDVRGTVQKAPAQAQAKQEWSLSDNGAKRLENQGVYVQASQVQRAG